MKIGVQIKVHDPRGFPAYHSEMAAGLDLVACLKEPVMLKPQAPAVLIPTGISIFIDDPNYAAVILPRSGFGHKKGLVLGNGTGLIDADYQGEVFVSAWNRNPTFKVWGGDPSLNQDDIITINPGERIAQLVFLPIARARFTVVEKFKPSARGVGGFGSTGVEVSTEEGC